MCQSSSYRFKTILWLSGYIWYNVGKMLDHEYNILLTVLRKTKDYEDEMDWQWQKSYQYYD